MRIRAVRTLLGPAAALVILGAVLLFLLAPLIVVIGASFDGAPQSLRGHAFLNFPPQEWSVHYYWQISARLYHALWVSLSVATVATLIATLVGVPAALGLVRSRIPAKALATALFQSPLQIPVLVTGVAFLQIYHLIDSSLGLSLTASFAGLVGAHVFVCTPYVVGTVSAVLYAFNPRLEEAALSLGATRWRTFRRVTLPVILPGVYAGALYAFMVSFGDVPIALFIAGPKYITLPLEIFETMQFEFDPATLALSTLIVVVSFFCVLLLQRIVGLDVVLRSGDTRS